MLSKLIKYEMKAYSRVLLPLYAAILAVAAADGLAWRFADATGNTVLAVFLAAAYMILVFAAAAVTAAAVILRFYRNLLGREGYLMFALPASVGEHIASKVLSAALWVILGIAAGAVSLPVIMTLSGSVPAEEWNEALRMVPYLAEQVAPYSASIVWGVIFLFLMMLAFLVRVYASIALGACADRHRFLWSVAAFIVLGILESFLTAFVAGAGVKIGILATGSIQLEENPMQLFLFTFSGCVYCLALVAVYWVVTWLCLDRKLNLE
jgi:hypothetical protein